MGSEDVSLKCSECSNVIEVTLRDVGFIISCLECGAQYKILKLTKRGVKAKTVPTAKVGVEAGIYLFGKPLWELEEIQNKFDPKKIKALGDELRNRLYKAAEAGEKLLEDEWDYAVFTGPGYSVEFYKDVTFKEAKRGLRELGIDKVVSLRRLLKE